MEIKDKPSINTSERLFDLVRYMRSELHRAQLITDAEYSWLCHDSPMATSPKGGSPSRERLEEYDEMRARLAELEKTLHNHSQFICRKCGLRQESPAASEAAKNPAF